MSFNHFFSLPLPDTSVVQLQPSISPCSHLLPVTRHEKWIPLVILLIAAHYVPTVVQCSVLHLVGLQFPCITGEPLDQVTRDHVAWATGKCRVGGTSILELLPLPNAIYCPALPETGSGWQIYHHHILSPFHLMHHCYDLSIPVSFISSSADDTLKLKSQAKYTSGFTTWSHAEQYLLPPPEIAALETLVVNLH